MPTATKTRSSSPPARPPAKKARREGPSASSSLNLPSGSTLAGHREAYHHAEPYKYAAIGDLISHGLLEAVVEESRTYGIRGGEGSLLGWGWEQKETDIYKIQQTPDLSSLHPDHLPDETLAALPNLTKLKDALYSPDFRAFIREVTGCGPLSGKKTDGSVGLYTKGSHLLLHDDSISTRLVSYILYLPNSPSSAPSSSSTSLESSASGSFLKGWDPAWGGSLELYPVEGGAEVGPPGVVRSGKVDVKWGQLVFFEVQPGRSYHAVEEVIVGDGRQRLGVSGWFHRPVEGEEEYEPFDKAKAQEDLSSLAQITSAPSMPFNPYATDPPPGLTPSHISFLALFLAPSYLTPRTLEKLSGQFVAASEIVLHNFLHPDLADKLKAETEAVDVRDYLDRLIPPQTCGEGDGWSISGPTSKHRYLSLSSPTTSTQTLNSILNTLLPSEAFRAWLSVVSSLAPTGYRAEARRFRRGLDYTLAAGEEKGGEARLDVWLGATWWADRPVAAENGEEDGNDEDMEHGGWECYLAAPDEGEDPAVYQSGAGRKEPNAVGANGETENAATIGHLSATDLNGQTGKKASDKGITPNGGDHIDAPSGPCISINGTELEIDPSQLSPSDFDSDSEEGEGDDGPLLTQPVAFNQLLLVLRDPGVMRFVKYLSAEARGSRWDVGGEWEVGVMEEDEEAGEADGP